MKALVVDDSSVIRKMLSFILEEQGLDVVTAEDGQLAWDCLVKHDPFDVLLVDWEMPNVDGLELVQRIRKNEKHQDSKILMITTHNSMSDLVAALSMGIDDYLMKPIDEDAVLDRLRMMDLID